MEIVLVLHVFFFQVRVINLRKSYYYTIFILILLPSHSNVNNNGYYTKCHLANGEKSVKT